MSYLALYRKYRPQKFDDIIGQDHITKTLTNQIKSGKIGHAYLFCGSRGTGKTTTARIFARAINCQNPENGSPCGKCDVCKALAKGEQFDIVEIDAASNNGVDDARELREAVKFLPVIGKKKVFIIDEVHMLSTSAFNALLKTLEEPPEHVVFIFGTTEIQKLPATILSRLMRFDFHLLSVAQIEHVLKQILNADKVDFEDLAVNMVARAGEGSMRDAISLLDSCLSYSPEKLTAKAVVTVLGSVGKDELLKLVEGCVANGTKTVIESLDALLVGGKSALVVTKDLLALLRDLLVVEALGDGAKSMVQADDQMFESYQNLAKLAGKNKLLKMVSVLGGVEAELRQSVHPRLVLEMALFRVMSVLDPIPEFSDGHKKATSQPELATNFVVTQKLTKSKNMLGELLQYLRKNGKMSLLAACLELEKLEVCGGRLVGLASAETKLAIESRSGELSEFFAQCGVSGICINCKKNQEQEKLEKLKKFFGDTLLVEE